MSLKKVVAAIRRNKCFLLTTHTNPEGDALGSELALYRLLKKIGKDAVVLNEDMLPLEYAFLPERESVRIYKSSLKNISFDCMVVLDCSDLSRTGEVYRINKENKPVVNIDHHISNRKFGTVNWVDPDASCASEMVYRIFKHMRVPLDKETALLLYVGILTDTGSFRYTNTTASTHKAASELVKFGFNVKEIYKKIYEDIPFKELQVLTKILPRIKRTYDGKIIWVEIPRNLLLKNKLSFDLAEQVLTYMRMIKEAQVVALFKENFGVRDEIRFNLRSNGAVDVNRIALYFGGGGHKTASGCTMHGNISAVRKKVLSRIRKSL